MDIPPPATVTATPFGPEALAAAGLRDAATAAAHLDALRRHPGGERVAAEILRLLRSEPGLVADADAALLALDRLLRNVREPARTLREDLGGPRRVQNVLAVLGASGYLGDVLLRHPEWLHHVSLLHSGAPRRSARDLRLELVAETGLEEPWATDSGSTRSNAPPATPDDAGLERALDGMRRFHQLQLLRIGARDLLAICDLEAVCGELSLTAETVVQAALELSFRSLDERPDPRGFCVLAFGKLGARELNYSSDVDLVYVAESDAPRYWTLATRIAEFLSRPTAEGFVHRVDLRLRPWGRDGPLVCGLDSYLDYVASQASVTELQSFLKARALCGDRALGERFLAAVRPYVFRERDPDALRANVRRLKERMEGSLRARGGSWGEVKSGEGSIRDVELTAQFLQLLHAPDSPDESLRAAATLDALDALRPNGFLDETDHRVLVQGYVFLRTLEHDLQLVGNLQTHRLPHDESRLRHVARRLGFRDEAGPEAPRSDATQRFLDRYREHALAVREVFRRHLEPPPPTRSGEPAGEPAAVRMPAGYLDTFSPADVERHRHLIAELAARGARVAVEIRRLDARRSRLEVVGRDALGTLSLVCGLLHAYRCDILEGQVFTSEEVSGAHAAAAHDAAPENRGERWLVDVFVVDAEDGEALHTFGADLEELFELLHEEGHTAAQLELAKRVSLALPAGDAAATGEPAALYPLDIEVDNGRSPRHTVLLIEGTDTPGFLYELTNALALSEIGIELMEVRTRGRRVRDTLWVTDRAGRKITDAAAVRRFKITTVLIKHFTHLLPRAPDPERALLHFHQLLDDLFARESWEDEIATLEQPTVLDSLARLLGQSDFLWHDFLRMQHENLFPVVQDLAGLEEARPRHELERALDDALGAAASEHRDRALGAFLDRETFRIDMRKILRRGATFDQFSRELTELAEMVCARRVELAYLDLATAWGEPRDADGELVPWTLLALGKFGGRELGFGSDLELMLVYRSEGRTSRAERSASELYRAMLGELRSALADRRTLALDLRLRPYGATGSLVVTRESFATYFAPQGDAWPYERQALVKMRAIAGDRRFGEEIERLRDELAYELGRPDPPASRALRERQIRHLVLPGTINAKFAPGALVDVEYLVQMLQMHHGRDRPLLRSTNTLAAIGELHAAGVLDAHDYDLLVDAYRFYRLLIDALRIVRGHAKDLTVPGADTEEYAFLARRLGFGAPEELRRELELHLRRIPVLQQRLLGELEADLGR